MNKAIKRNKWRFGGREWNERTQAEKSHLARSHNLSLLVSTSRRGRRQQKVQFNERTSCLKKKQRISQRKTKVTHSWSNHKAKPLLLAFIYEMLLIMLMFTVKAGAEWLHSRSRIGKEDPLDSSTLQGSEELWRLLHQLWKTEVGRGRGKIAFYQREAHRTVAFDPWAVCSRERNFKKLNSELLN